LSGQNRAPCQSSRKERSRERRKDAKSIAVSKSVSGKPDTRPNQAQNRAGKPMQLSEAQNLTINTQEHTNFRKLGGKCRESRAQNEQLSKPKLTNHKRRPWPTQTQGERERERESLLSHSQ